MNKKIKWGIIGLGKIANKFAEDLQLLTDTELYAVASRDVEKAEKFSEKYSYSVVHTILVICTEISKNNNILQNNLENRYQKFELQVVCYFFNISFLYLEV